jgi:hypothetical protein
LENSNNQLIAGITPRRACGDVNGGLWCRYEQAFTDAVISQIIWNDKENST